MTNTANVMVCLRFVSQGGGGQKGAYFSEGGAFAIVRCFVF